MTNKELKRVKVLAMVLAEQLTVAKAAELLGVCERHGWRLLACYRQEGPAGLVHGNRGRVSQSTIPTRTQRSSVW